MESSDRVYIGLELDKLVELMQKGDICGADIHVLSVEAKELVQQACLKSCVKKMCSGCEMSDECGRFQCISATPIGQIKRHWSNIND